MSFLTTISKVLAQHEQALNEVAEYETNSRMLTLSLQLGRLRTIEEQIELLTYHYKESIAALKALDEQGVPHFMVLNEALPQADVST